VSVRGASVEDGDRWIADGQPISGQGYANEIAGIADLESNGVLAAWR